MERVKFAKPIDKDYTCVNRKFLSDLLTDKSDLSKASLRMLFYVIANMNETGLFSVGNMNRIAADCHINQSVVSKGFSELVNKGYIIREDTHTFRFNPECLPKEEDNNDKDS
jgi:DNA-binding MarR family transcriptional regulator